MSEKWETFAGSTSSNYLYVFGFWTSNLKMLLRTLVIFFSLSLSETFKTKKKKKRIEKDFFLLELHEHKTSRSTSPLSFSCLIFSLDFLKCYIVF